MSICKLFAISKEHLMSLSIEDYYDYLNEFYRQIESERKLQK